MKKAISVVIILLMVLILAACSGKSDPSLALTKEGVAPYELSEREANLLQSLGIKDTSQIISFKAPKEAIALNVNVYRLGDDGKWVNYGGGGMSIGEEKEPVDLLLGSVSLQLRDNYSIAFNINSGGGGTASYKTDEITLDSSVIASAKGFLREYQSIELNKEIPVAIMVYDDGTSMKSYSLQDYFEPSRFEGMDLVQIVTLVFSDSKDV